MAAHAQCSAVLIRTTAALLHRTGAGRSGGAECTPGSAGCQVPPALAQHYPAIVSKALLLLMTSSSLIQPTHAAAFDDVDDEGTQAHPSTQNVLTMYLICAQ